MKKYLTKFFFLLVAIELVIIFHSIVLTNPTVASAIEKGTTYAPERFTELYFENHTELPHTIITNKAYSFSFTIHNLEGKTVRYPYEVYVDANGEKIFIGKGEVTLKDDESKTINQTFTTKDIFPRSKIIVNLINKRQHISYWMEGVNG